MLMAKNLPPLDLSEGQKSELAELLKKSGTNSTTLAGCLKTVLGYPVTMNQVQRELMFNGRINAARYIEIHGQKRKNGAAR
jgi:hypothetical protein